MGEPGVWECQQPCCPWAVGSRLGEGDICFGSKHPPGSLGKSMSYREKWDGEHGFSFVVRFCHFEGCLHWDIVFFLISLQLYLHLGLTAAALELPPTTSIYCLLKYIRKDTSRLDFKEHVWMEKSDNFLSSNVRTEFSSLSALFSSISLKGSDTFICIGGKCLLSIEDKKSFLTLGTE